MFWHITTPNLPRYVPCYFVFFYKNKVSGFTWERSTQDCKVPHILFSASNHSGFAKIPQTIVLFVFDPMLEVKVLNPLVTSPIDTKSSKDDSLLLTGTTVDTTMSKSISCSNYHWWQGVPGIWSPSRQATKKERSTTHATIVCCQHRMCSPIFSRPQSIKMLVEDNQFSVSSTLDFLGRQEYRDKPPSEILIRAIYVMGRDRPWDPPFPPVGNSDQHHHPSICGMFHSSMLCRCTWSKGIMHDLSIILWLGTHCVLQFHLLWLFWVWISLGVSS